jgi:hypothetical protein
MLITFSVFSQAGCGCRLFDATFCASEAPYKVLHLYYTSSASGSLNFDKIKFRYQTSI